MRGLDIFCGAGGSSLGASAAGVEIVGGVDMCPIATETFASNFPGAHVVTSRLEEVKPAELKKAIGNIDILLASPECTNHTCAKGAAPRDEESRATAMLVTKYAKTFRPRWLVLENVVHMRPWSRYEELKQDLRGLGYNINEQVLNASDFGVPQSRRRLFLVGDREREPILVSQKKRGPKKSAKSILDPSGTWKTSPLFLERRAKGTIERANRGIASLGEGASFLLVYYGTDGAGGWQPLNRPLRTVTTIDRFALVEHDGQSYTMRMLQVSELQRAMGFGPNHVLVTGTRREKIKLLGNGVCPPVMENVVRSLTASE